MNWGVDPSTGRHIPCDNNGFTYGGGSQPAQVIPIYSPQG